MSEMQIAIGDRENRRVQVGASRSCVGVPPGPRTNSQVADPFAHRDELVANTIVAVLRHSIIAWKRANPQPT